MKGNADHQVTSGYMSEGWEAFTVLNLGRRAGRGGGYMLERLFRRVSKAVGGRWRRWCSCP